MEILIMNSITIVCFILAIIVLYKLNKLDINTTEEQFMGNNLLYYTFFVKYIPVLYMLGVLFWFNLAIFFIFTLFSSISLIIIHIITYILLIGSRSKDKFVINVKSNLISELVFYFIWLWSVNSIYPDNKIELDNLHKEIVEDWTNR